MSVAEPQNAPPPKMTGAEYLAREHEAEMRSEFVNGRVLPMGSHVLAMSGSSLPHSHIVGALHEIMGPKLRARGWSGVSHDLRVHVQSQDCYFYPDFVIFYGPPQMLPGPTDTLLNPSVLIEILSPSTEGYDRGEKFFHYQQIPSLQQYVLVSQDRPLVEIYTRQTDGSWRYEAFSGLAATATLASVEATVPLAELYRDVTSAP
jgi:Uma2 family endonuclease